MKNIVIINSSPRKDGNSETLAKSFADGAKEAGNNVEFINLREKRINYCRGCYACRQLGKCFQDDDMNDIVKKLVKADVILFSTPVYFYTMNGQMKVFIDRCVQKYTKIHADIYIFDEALSQIDVVKERDILINIFKYLKDKTTTSYISSLINLCLRSSFMKLPLLKSIS